MTGFGQASLHAGETACSVEVRTVNNRFFKLHVKLPESLARFENPIEKVVRDSIRRGTVSLTLQLRGGRSQLPARINGPIVRAYLNQLKEVVGPGSQEGLLAAVLSLPGSVEDADAATDVESDWPLIERTIRAALGQLQEMRSVEGAAMQAELLDLAKAIESVVDEVDRRAPVSLEQHRDRLQARVQSALAAHDVSVEKSDLLRELALFADRFDIAEEITRLRSHLVQFRSILNEVEGVGRKLDFLTQELHREANTIGSKANDAGIAALVVDAKTRIERIREIVQNVE